MIKLSRVLALGSSAALAAASALHLAWGAGSSWPARDRQTLAEDMAGTAEVPSPAACFAVGGALAGAAAVVAGLGGPLCLGIGVAAAASLVTRSRRR